MSIEQFSDEHGIYFRASEEAFLVSKEEAASIRKYIDELRELVKDMWSAYHDGATNKEFRALPDRMRELGIEVD